MALTIGIIGGGAWGSALALGVVRAGHTPVIYSRRSSAGWRTDITQSLPDCVDILTSITADNRYDILKDADIILYVGKAQQMRSVLHDISDSGVYPTAAPFVICSKGIEAGSGALLHDIAASIMADTTPICMLSGPNFATEIARGLPAAAVIASSDITASRLCVEAFTHEAFRVYLSQDITGVALCGALKNVIAIACGMADGHALGQNARAALITRSLAELARLITAAGGDPATVNGLSGIGDMMLTCTSDMSRNYRFGRALADPASANAGRLTAEGADTAKGVMHVAAHYHTELPICAAVARILCGGSSFNEEVKNLLGRPVSFE